MQNQYQFKPIGLSTIQTKCVQDEYLRKRLPVDQVPTSPSDQFVALLHKIYPRKFLNNGIPIPGPQGGFLKDQFGRVVWAPRFCKQYSNSQLVSDGIQFFVAQENGNGGVSLFDPTGQFAPPPIPGRPAIIVGNSNPDELIYPE